MLLTGPDSYEPDGPFRDACRGHRFYGVSPGMKDDGEATGYAEHGRGSWK